MVAPDMVPYCLFCADRIIHICHYKRIILHITHHEEGRTLRHAPVPSRARRLYRALFPVYPLPMVADVPDLRQIEAYCAVMTSGSMTGGARLLGRSQSMITRLIQDLEISLGFALFHRSGPRITATDQGIRFHREAQILLGTVNRLQENARAIARNAESSLLVAGTFALAAGLYPRAIGRLPGALLPGTLHVQSASAQEVIHMVARKEANLGIVSFPFNNLGVELAWIGEADCVMALSAHDELAAYETIDIASLSGRRILTMADPFRIRSRIERALAQSNVIPAGITDSNMAIILFRLACEGLGVAILDPVTARSHKDPGIVIRPLNVRIPYFFSVVTPGGVASSAGINELTSLLRQEAQAMLPDVRFHDGDSTILPDGEPEGTDPMLRPLDT
ncbi:LysR family transcriptional regulator [Komagataeibacter rhaeticus]|uniref:LysR family transcriptional regulator n=2 Tax=Komagataeibacter rhaeticus TaxID=215221 RepID=UPI000A03A57E